MEVIDVDGSDITIEQAAFVLKAQSYLRANYDGPIAIDDYLTLTFAIDNGSILGCLAHYKPSRSKFTWVTTAFVDEAHRRKGVLRSMLAGIKGEIRLDTAPNNLAMQAAMSALGFKNYSLNYKRQGAE